MKKLLSLTLFAAILTCLMPKSIQAQTSDFHEVLKKFNAAVEKYDKLEYDFISKERRRNGKFIDTDGHFKVIEGANKKVSANLSEPDKAKLFWRKGINNDKVSVKKGIAPWLGLKLTNNLLLAKSHQTIDNAGFGLPKKTINIIYNNRKDEINEAVKFKGEVNFDGKTCLHYVITDKNHGTTSYTVKEGENLISIAQQRAINQMQILELNSSINNYFDVEAGDVITIPNSFGTQIVIYLDKTTYLPLYMKIEDGKGIVGEYSHMNLNIAPVFTDTDFTKGGFE